VEVVVTRVRDLRLSKKLSQHALAAAAGLHYRTIQEIEAGGDLRVGTAQKIAAVLGVSLDELVAEERTA
jgi:transcriptional regulator with XRE-family HTH domain